MTRALVFWNNSDIESVIFQLKTNLIELAKIVIF